MHGDFSRLTFRPRDHFSRVLVQQGRVYLDAEPNEQSAIHLHLLRSVCRDLFGPHGTPVLDVPNEGFRISDPPAGGGDGFRIGPGHYYVDGILCENETETFYRTQPNFFPAQGEALPDDTLVYLDVWERHVTWIEHGRLREPALGGTDGASRAQVVWQVRVQPFKGFALPIAPDQIAERAEERDANHRPRLRARVRPGDVSTTPCILPPSAGYRGPENQLYRIEIHRPGAAGVATFKWSRDNGSIVFPIVAHADKSVRVAGLGRDSTRALAPGMCVEILGDGNALHGVPGALARVVKVTASTGDVQVEPFEPGNAFAEVAGHAPTMLRRWDHRPDPAAGGARALAETAADQDAWIDVEQGIQIRFPQLDAGQQRRYVTGDYWEIPARAGTGSIEWPDEAAEVAPWGIEHHYAPLARLVNGAVTERYRMIVPLARQKEPDV